MDKQHISYKTGSAGKLREKGFTLIEIMIVVAIIAIIASIAYPSYMDSIRKSKRSDAQASLVAFAGAMEKHFTQNNSYLGAAQSGDTGAPAIFASTSPIGGGTTAYDLTIHAATGSSYTLRATPVGPQIVDGIIEYTSTGQKRWDENNSGTFDANEFDWKIN